MSNITPFIFDAQPIRVIERSGDPWFVAADCAHALEYASAKDFVRGLDPEDRDRHIVPTPSGDQEMTIVSEGGLYTALVRARTERAKPFRRWVTHEVLPAIRRTGIYAVDPQPQLSGKELLAAAVLEAAETIRQHEATIAQQAKELEAAAPKARTWDLIVSGDGSYTITDAAKTLASAGVQTGPRILHRQLAEAGWLYKNQRNRWVAYQDRLNSGDLVEKPRPYIDEDGAAQLATPQVRITAKGLAALRELLTVEDGAA